jgi:hypothetical protein
MRDYNLAYEILPRHVPTDIFGDLDVDSLTCRRIIPMRSRRGVTLCELQEDPARYDQKLISATGFVSRDFEDFTFSDPACPSDNVGIWLEYGGMAKSSTVYCCGETNGVLSFYAADKNKIAWVVVAAYEYSC